MLTEEQKAKLAEIQPEIPVHCSPRALEQLQETAGLLSDAIGEAGDSGGAVRMMYGNWVDVRELCRFVLSLKASEVPHAPVS